MVKKSLLLVYRLAFWLISSIAVILIAAALCIEFWLFPNIHLYKNDIAQFASKLAQQKIVIGQIQVGWQGVNPHFVVSDIDLYDAQNRPALQLKNTDLSLSWLSLPLLEPRLANFSLHAPELTIRRNTQGEVFVAGISMQGPAKPELANWLLRQSAFNVSDAKVIWIDELRGAPALSLDKLNLSVQSPPWKRLLKSHQINLSALPSSGTSSPIQLQARLYGSDVSQLANWHGQLELNIKNVDLMAYQTWVDYRLLSPSVALKNGRGDVKLILAFENQQWQSVSSTLALSDVQLDLPAQNNALIMRSLSGELAWAKTDTEENYSAMHLTVQSNHDLSLHDATVHYLKSKSANDTLKVQLAKLDLAMLQAHAAQLPIPQAWQDKIKQLSPSGQLSELNLSWQTDKGKTTGYQVQTKFQNLNLAAHDSLPGFSNLSGTISANQNAGKLQLNTTHAKLDLTSTLRYPTAVDSLNGNISWSRHDLLTNIHVGQLHFSNPDLSATVNADYVMDSAKGDYLDLKAQVAKADAKYALRYYPKALGETTLHWLDTSILSGQIEDVNVVIKGRLADFPFVDKQNRPLPNLGQFRVTAKLSHSLMEYGTGWPEIEDLGLDMLFEGKRMELNAFSGHLLGNQIVKSKVAIPQLDAAEPMLYIDSTYKGPVAESIKFINKSPVQEATQGFTEDLITSGQGKLDLKLIIPMNDLDAAKYQGQYLISNGSMDEINIPKLTAINGVLDFTESSLTAKNINANAFGTPLSFNLSSGKDKIIRINAKGKMNDAAIRQVLLNQNPKGNLAKAAGYIAGSANWQSDITIQKPLVNIAIRSDLVGLSSRLPVPFNKTSNERLMLRVDKNQSLNNDALSVALGRKLFAQVVRTKENGQLKFDRANLRFNNGPGSNDELNPKYDLIKVKGLQLSGSLDYLDADAWRRVMQDVSGDISTSSTPPIQKIALKINTLDIFDRRIHQLKVINNPNKAGLSITVQSRELSGDLNYTNDNKLNARLSHLSIPEASPNKIKPASKDVGLSTYPALDIAADRFEWDNKNLGAMELIAYPQNNNWAIQKLKLSNPESSISADGQWNNWQKNPSTYLNVSWDIKNLGETLKNLGHPNTVKRGEGSLNGQLQWAGNPYDFNPVEINGNLQLEMKKGQILKVQPGVGRLLGLLSLQSLPRRLSLDFRDLFSNGFAFDKIKASAKINSGVIYSDDFVMSGPAADVSIKGETNLQKETQHLYVKVLPHISDSLSLAALAGGPLAGAVAFLAQKILKDPLNKISSTEYEIIGTWDNPQEVKNNKEDTEAPAN
ncbi:MAG: hypothetical protein RIR60_39 [Pseudomonadota bacterium]